MQIESLQSAASEYEIKKWSSWFTEALQGQGQEAEQGYFWQYCEKDSNAVLNGCITGTSKSEISLAELACGAGRVSISLAGNPRIKTVTLFDGASSALEYAESITPKNLANKVSYVEGNIFNTGFDDNKFDIVWNCGVVEHYSRADIKKIVSEMYRVTAPQGYLIIAVPNRNSLAALKACILGKSVLSKYLKWISGYRYDTEISYSNHAMVLMIRDAIGQSPEISYAGSPLWVTAPGIACKIGGFIGKKLGCSFLTYLVIRKK